MYASPISVQVNGVSVGLVLDQTRQSTRPASSSYRNEPEAVGTQPRANNIAGAALGATATLEDAVIPSPEDLAKSFLQQEPASDTADLRAELSSYSADLQQSATSVETEQDTTGYGTGGNAVLPGFLAGFFAGVADRLEIAVEDVVIRVAMSIDPPNAQRTSGSIGQRLQLPLEIACCFERLDIQGVTSDVGDDHPTIESNETKPGKRLVALHGLRTYVRFDNARLTHSDESRMSKAARNESLHDWSDPVAVSEERPQTQRDSDDDGYKTPGHESQFDPDSSPSSVVPTHSSSERLPAKVEAPYTSVDPGLIADVERELGTNSESGSHKTEHILNIDDALGANLSTSDNLHHALQSFRRERTPLDRRRLKQRKPADTPQRSSRSRDSVSFETGAEAFGAGAETLHTEPVTTPTTTTPPVEHNNDHECPIENDTLTESKFFSHDDAASIYMSVADVLAEERLADVKNATMPGAWEESEAPHEYQDLTSQRLSNPSTLQFSASTSEEPRFYETEGDSDAKNPLARRRTAHSPPTRQNDTSNSASTDQSHEQIKKDAGRKELLRATQVKLWVPSLIPEVGSSADSGELHKHKRDVTVSGQFSSQPLDQPHHGIPGAFSTYAESAMLARSQVSGSERPSSKNRVPTRDREKAQSDEPSIDLDIETLTTSTSLDDIAIILQIFKGLQTASNLSSAPPKTTNDLPETSQSQFLLPKNMVHMHIGTLSTAISSRRDVNEQVHMDFASSSSSVPGLSEPIFLLRLQHVDLYATMDRFLKSADLKVRNFEIDIAGQQTVRFNQNASMQSSIRSTQAFLSHDFVLHYCKRSGASEVNMTTMPLAVDLDVTKIDETLADVGGFSAIIDMSSCFAPDTECERAVKPDPPVRPRVRFEQMPISKSPAEPSRVASLKTNVRVKGSSITLRAGNRSFQFSSTSIKAVIRAGAVGVQVDDSELVGPLLVMPIRAKAASIRARNLNIRYLERPEEQDLARLISLVTPSKDNFERGDGGILVETLVRQREGGAAVRASLSELSIEIGDFSAIDDSRQFLEEIGRLSAITKYLPEETRPGLLALVHIGRINLHSAQAPFVGDSTCILSEFQLANITAPSLLAMSVETISVMRAPKQELVHAVLPRHLSEHDVMLMVRLVGDEVIPCVEVKLMNVCIEYNVVVLMDMLDIEDGLHGVDAMAASVMPLRNENSKDRSVKPKTYQAADRTTSSTSITSLRIDLGLRNSAIGLTPRELPSKGLFVLTNARMQYNQGITDFSTTDIDLRKAALLLTDDRDALSGSQLLESESTSQVGQQIPLLCQQGYVSVCWISAAHTYVTAQYEAGEASVLDVEFDDELFVLETCADSTATLSQLLSALQPPSRPSRDAKYRTEATTLEDMMASFTGEIFPASSAARPQFPDTDALDNDENAGTEDFQEPAATTTHQPSVERSVSSGLFDLDQEIYTERSHTRELRETIVPDHPITGGLTPTALPQQAHATAAKWDSDRNKYIQVSQSEALASPFKLQVKNMHVIWNLHDGYDWQKTREAISKAVQDIEARSEEKRSKQRHLYDEEDDIEPVIGDFLFNSIYVGVPVNHDPKELTREINRNVDDLVSQTASHATTATDATPRRYRSSRARKRLKLQRGQRHKITFELGGISADMFIYSPNQETVSSTDIRVRDFDIFDHVPTSTWKKFATYMRDAGPREEKKPMVHLEICNVKPMPELLASELVIKATVLPVRLHVDQDALDFITRFFAFSDDSDNNADRSGDQPYIQRVEVLPVPIKLDYKPKKVDYVGLRSGRTKEFMNFFNLDSADMVLKHAIIYGCNSFSRLHSSLEDIWMPDITTKQLPTVLSGLNGVRTLVNVGGGFRNLVTIPIQEYRKDGRIVRSISRGAWSFVRTSGSEITKFGAKLAVGAQTALQGAEDFLVKPQQPDDADWETADLDEEEEEKRAFSHYADQPTGILSGLKGAAKSLERDLLLTRDVIVAVSGEARESGSLEGVAKAVARHAPTIVLRPMIGASKAVSQTLMGATNTVDPQNRRRIEDVSSVNHIRATSS